MAKPPFDMTDAELKAAIRGTVHVNYFVADWQRELDSRQASRITRLASRIAISGAVAAVCAATAAVLALFD